MEADSLLIVFAGYEILKEVFSGQLSLPVNIPMTITGIVATMVIAWLFSRYEMKIGLQTRSPSLVADPRHILTDVLSSLILALAAAALTTPLGMLISYPVISVIDKSTLGPLLSLSGGTLVYVGATHLLPRAEQEHKHLNSDLDSRGLS